MSVTDDQALEGFQLLCRTEGIIPALEPSHAVYHVARLAPKLDREQIILLGLSGRGDKDMDTVAVCAWSGDVSQPAYEITPKTLRITTSSQP